MDKGKAEILVESLVVYAQDVGYYTGREEVGSPHYREAKKRRDELKSKIISHLTDEVEVGNG